jgi:hypothetical protein
MKSRFILYRRKHGGMFYVEDTRTKKQESLGTKIRAEAIILLNARNESARQPQLNLQIAKAYLAGTDSGVSTRTWQDAFNAIIDHKTGSTQERWQRGSRQKAFELIHRLVIVETQAEQLFTCLKAGTVSTNILLREQPIGHGHRAVRHRPGAGDTAGVRIEQRERQVVTAAGDSSSIVEPALIAERRALGMSGDEVEDGEQQQ